MSENHTSEPVTIVGRLTWDPKLEYSPSGKAMTKVGIAVNKGHYEGEDWVSEPPVFWNVTVWEQQGENLAEDHKKGDRVIVYGKHEEPREYDKADGSKGVADHEITAWEFGPSERFNTVSVNRNERGAARADVGASL